MARYDRIYSIFARRAVQQGGIDVEAFVEQSIAAGLSEDTIQEMLLQDLEEGGPIFGRFFRSLIGAAEKSTMAASRQGEVVGEVAANETLSRLLRIDETVGSVIENADPVDLQAIEDASADRLELTWVAELVNTCERCLPLHGTTRTLTEWRESGLHPESIHSGWVSPCRCKLIAEKQFNRPELLQPLVRNKVKTATGLKGSRRTMRGVTQKDLERSQAARDKALESLEGRRTLRILGQSNKEAVANDGSEEG